MQHDRRSERRLAYALSVAAGLMLLGSCGRNNSPPADSGPPPLTAATLGTQSPRSVAEYLSEPEFANASPELGERLLMQCAACHRFDKDQGHGLGPNLHGVFGRKAGSLTDFGYTRAFGEAGFTWTPRALNAWLANPSRFLPGNAMAFAGIRDPDDRAALIAALLRRTGD